MSDLKDLIKKKAQEIFEKVRTDRRHLHSNPELSFQEYNTSAYVCQRLDEIGISYKKGVAGTGIVAEINGDSKGKTIALRGDMDALPITEANDIEYKSKNPGVMHACGHDVHTSCLLGAAEILYSIKTHLKGNIRLIFQPGEEKLPGGASMMIKEGALEDPRPAGIIGQHVMPHIDAGKVGFRSGIYMASTDELYLTVKGRGGHGAMPHLNIDPVLIASHIIVALQQVVSRSANPATPSVLSFGKFIAEGATNVIPDEAKLEGTFRTFNEDWRTKAHEKMQKIATSLAEGMGATIDFEIRRGYPFLVNEPELTARNIDRAKDYLGEENVEELDIWMAAEDFAYYSQVMPACFYRLGVRNEKMGITSSVHTPTFNIDESALLVGAGLMAWLAVSELNS